MSDERLRADLAASRTRERALERSIAEVVAASVSSNADDEHDPEGATIAFERQQLVALLGSTRRTTAALLRALEALAEGRYGFCRHCGGDIAAGRLEARPQARSCIACARAGLD